MTKAYPKYYYLLLIFAAILFAITFVYEHQYISNLNNRNAVLQNVQNVVNAKTNTIESYFVKLSVQLFKLDKNDPDAFRKLSQQLTSPEKDFTFFIYKNDELVYWSDNSIGLSAANKAHIGNEQVGYWGSSYYEFFRTTAGEYSVTGLLLIKRSAAKFENKYIRNDFNPDFNLTENVFFASDQSTTQKFPVYNTQHQVLFSLLFDGETIKPVPLLIPVLFFIALLLFMIWAYTVVVYFLRVEITYSFVIIMAMVVAIYVVFIVFRIPKSLFELTLFSPLLYASSNLLGSLGLLIIFTLLLTIIVLSIFNYVDVIHIETETKNRTFWNTLLLGSAFIIVNFYAALVNYLISGLVLNSKITFDLNNLLELTHYSFIGLSVIFLLMFTFYLMCDICIRLILKTKLKYKLLFTSFIAAQCIFLICYYGLQNFHFIPALSLTNYLQSAATLTLTALLVILTKRRFTFYNSIILITIFALFTSKTINDLNVSMEREQRKTFADKLQNQQDLLAEFLFEDLAQKIQKDKILISNFQVDDSTIYFDNDAQAKINSRLQQNYFNSYWSGYNIEAKAFNYNGLPISNPLDPYLDVSIYQRKIETECNPTEVKNLYSYKNNTGGTAYLAYLVLRDSDNDNEPVGTLVLELNSKVTKNESGYPEFLISQKQANQMVRNTYSYASYKKDLLVNKGGNFPFTVSDLEYKKKMAGKKEVFDERYGISYLFRVFEDGDMIVVSTKSSSIKSFFTLFSYTFTFFFTLFTFLFFGYKLVVSNYHIGVDFKNRIQLTVTSIIIVVMLSIGSITIYNLIINFNGVQNQKLIEKINSVLLVIENETRDKSFTRDQIEDTWQYKFSEISSSLNCDFNIYDTYGFLIYSTQPKVFELNILGQNMNRKAFDELKGNPKLNLVQAEKIGTLNYIAAYEPIRNASNKTVAFLNLPYFKNETDLRNEISSLLVVLINIYVPIFLLSILITLFFSRRLAQPLQLIQTSLSKVRLNKANPLIEWKRNDEIGALVKEYNRMVRELQASAENLAQSERETAWREMARQVAHEIKNPLTPMKLSVQFLQRAMNDGSPDMDAMIKRFSENLVVQIDTLSNIATEFSNFAKMPMANNAVIDLQTVLKNSAELYDAEDETRIIFHKSNDEMLVYADKGQLLRVFSNLLKNALQSISIPENGLVTITVNDEGAEYFIAVSDNGIGITDEQREKIFKPNFTTKSTGTGLGLAMSKQIIENAKGRLWFESEIDRGTTFFVSLPKYVNQ